MFESKTRSWLYGFYVAVLILSCILGFLLGEEHLAFLPTLGLIILVSLFLMLLKLITDGKIFAIGEQSRSIHAGFFFLSWLVIFVSWLPVFFAYYPVLFTYDAPNQYAQIISGHYTTHHPLAHTLVCKFFFDLGNILGSSECGFVLLSIFQMLLLSGVMAYAVFFLRKLNIKKLLCLCLLVWFMLFPANPILAISITKDVIFSAIFLLLTILLMQRFNPERHRLSDWLIAPLVCLLCLFRNNFIYVALIVVAVLFLVWVIKKRNDKNFLVVCLSIFIGVILGFCATLALNKSVGAATGSAVEALSVPAQQIALVYTEDKDSLSANEKEWILSIVDEEGLSEYRRVLADPVKRHFDIFAVKAVPLRFLKNYLILGLEHPLQFVRAFLILNLGYWFLGDTSHANVYLDLDRGGYLLTYMSPVSGGCELVAHSSFLPALENVYEDIASNNIQYDIPVLSVLFSPAFYIWVLLACFVVCYKKKSFRSIGPILLLVVIYLFSLLFGPCALVRYAYPLMITALPVFFVSWALSQDIHS